MSTVLIARLRAPFRAALHRKANRKAVALTALAATMRADGLDQEARSIEDTANGWAKMAAGLEAER